MFNHEKWASVELAKARVNCAVEIVRETNLQQPALAKVRKFAIDEIHVCAETFAAFERENGNSEDQAQRLHDSFYNWLTANLRVVSGYVEVK